MAFCLKIFRMGKPGGGGVIADRRDRSPADGGPLRPGKGAFRTVAGKFIRAGKRCVRNFFLSLKANYPYIMDLIRLRSELQRLSEIVGGWNAPEEISALERDLVLEKLRGLYDAVRFGGVADAQLAEEPAPEAAFPIDLGEVLSLDPAAGAAAVPDDGPDFGGVAAEETSVAGLPEIRPESAPEPVVPAPESAGLVPGAAAPAPESEPFASDFVPETAQSAPFAPGIVPDAAFVPVPESVAALDSDGDPAPAVSAEPEAAPEAVVVPEPQAVPDPVAEPEIAQPSADSVSEGPVSADPVPASSGDAPAAVRVPADSGEADASGDAAEGTSHPVAPTLFGLEEATLRHRHKQRVIMSLYDTAEPAPKPAPHSVAGPAAAAAPRPDSVRENSAGAGVFARVSASEAAREAAEHPAVEEPAGPSGGESVADFASAAPGAVLGDVINHDVQTLADTIAPPRDIASELRRSEPVTDLHRAIGINDKFLMIRDLFGGDGEAFDAALDALNGFGDLDDCMIYIAENYAWNANSDGAKLLMELLERKFA